MSSEAKIINRLAMNFASCCHPIPDDKIIGIINTGSGIVIHNQDCSHAKNIVTNPQMLIDVCWKERLDKDNVLYYSRIKLLLKNQSGALADVSNAMAKRDLNISNIDIVNRKQDFFELILDIEVKDTKHLENIIVSLRILDKVIEVTRFES